MNVGMMTAEDSVADLMTGAGLAQGHVIDLIAEAGQGLLGDDLCLHDEDQGHPGAPAAYPETVVELAPAPDLPAGGLGPGHPAGALS